MRSAGSPAAERVLACVLVFARVVGFWPGVGAIASDGLAGVVGRVRVGGNGIMIAAGPLSTDLARWVRGRLRVGVMVGGGALLLVVLALAGCGAGSALSSTATGALSSTANSTPSSTSGGTAGDAFPKARPQVIEPTAGAQPVAVTPDAPVGDVNAHAPSLAEVKKELRLELIAAPVSNATYIDPLRYVAVWERTDQGVDATLPPGAPILAPCTVKVLAIIPDWYAGQPLVYFELLSGPDAGKVQYVAEQISDITPGGSILAQGQVIARYAASGTGIEYGWSTLNGVTLARATTGYEEGRATPAGESMRAWLNSLGANAGNG